MEWNGKAFGFGFVIAMDTLFEEWVLYLSIPFGGFGCRGVEGEGKGEGWRWGWFYSFIGSIYTYPGDFLLSI